MTITEALAELKTVDKRIASKREFVRNYLHRPDGIKDPLEKDGGSSKLIEQELQAIRDLEDRVVTIRRGIQKANDSTSVSVEGIVKSISDWLIWRREVAPKTERFLRELRTHLNALRDQARRQGVNVFVQNNQAEKPTDIIVNINEKELALDSEQITNILGQLDGQLSLKNATVMVSE